MTAMMLLGKVVLCAFAYVGVYLVLFMFDQWLHNRKTKREARYELFR